MSQIIFIIYLSPVWQKLVEKCSGFIQISHSQYFKYANLDFDTKNDFFYIFTNCSTRISCKIENDQVLIKFATFHISNIPILILMSKIIFIKCLPSLRTKLFPKLKVLRIYWNLAHSIFQRCQSRFWCSK